MRKSRFNEEQIIAILKESEAGVETGNCAGGTRCLVGTITMESFNLIPAEPTGLIPIQTMDLVQINLATSAPAGT